MFDLLLCHSSSDTQLANAVAERLRCASEAEVWLQPCPSPVGRTIVEAWECGLSSRAIVLLLSPDAVPHRLKRQEWNALLQHIEQESLPPVLTLLLADCPYPKLLERNHFYRYCDAPTGALRAICSWLLENHLGGLAPLCVPADLPWFTGREQELSLLWDVLVDGAGTVALSNPKAATGKTCLAQKFARAASPHFRDILWVDCAERSPAAIAGELASQSGISAEGPLEQVLARLQSLFEEHRLLVVLDDLAAPFPLAPHTSRARTSLLITTRDAGSYWPADLQVFQIDDAELPRQKPAMDAAEQKLWQAMSVCRRSGFSLAFAAAIAEMEESGARAICGRLIEARYVEQFEPIRGWLRTAAAQIGQRQPETEQLHRKHAEVLSTAFKEWWKRPDPCADLIGEVAPAFRWALTADWDLAAALGERAFAYLKSKGRLLEAAELCQQLGDAARERGDTRIAETCAWELSWIQDEQGVVRPQSVSAEQLAFNFQPPLRSAQLI